MGVWLMGLRRLGSSTANADANALQRTENTELLQDIKLLMKKQEAHLSIMTGEELADDDVEVMEE